MDKEQYDWEIKITQGRHEYLELSVLQAEKVREFENSNGNNPLLSMWEEFDLERESFRTILDETQYARYEENLSEIIRLNELRLIEQDNEYLDHLKYNSEILLYLEKTFIPSLLNDTKFRLDFWLDGLKAYQPEIDKFKASYQAFLAHRKKEIIANHKKYYRTFKPNELKNSLIQHQISSLWPNYFEFKPQMNNATRITQEYLSKNIQESFKVAHAFIQGKCAESTQHTVKLQEKYLGKPQGWQIDIKVGDHELFENDLMTILLLDKEKFLDKLP